MAVNGELDQLTTLLESAAELVRPDGVAAFISFHSLEDRLVKRALLDRTIWRRVTKKPIVPSDTEQAQNPRARSAKLRVAVRVSDVELPSEPPDSEDEIELPNWYGARSDGAAARSDLDFESDGDGT
jgi:16S rRNA (cytosine1402-N4)-methyltransferase